MKIELTHDIMAKKIWEQLPEQDRMYRTIKSAVQRRRNEKENHKGSLLSEQEYDEWKVYFKKGTWEKEELAFIEESRQAIVQKQNEKERERKEKIELLEKKNRFFLWTTILASAVLLLLLLFIAYASFQKEQNRKKDLKFAIEKAIDFKENGKYAQAVFQLEEANNYVKLEDEQQQINTKKDTFHQLDTFWLSAEKETNLRLKLEKFKKMKAISTDDFLDNLIKETDQNLEEKYTSLIEKGKSFFTMGESSKSLVTLFFAYKKFEDALALKPKSKEAEKYQNKVLKLMDDLNND